LETSSVKALIAYKKGLTVASFLHAHHLKQKEKIETITNLVDNQVMLGDMHTHQQSQGPANGILQFISEYRSTGQDSLFREPKIKYEFLSHIITNMKHRQRELVHETGFGFLFYTPLQFRLCPATSAWLLGNFDPDTRTLFPNMAFKIALKSKYIETCMGIPSGGIIIRPPNTTDMQLVKDHVAHILSSNFTKKTLTFSRARQVISDLHNIDTLSKEKEQAFQIAFVCMLLGHSLLPGLARAPLLWRLQQFGLWRIQKELQNVTGPYTQWNTWCTLLVPSNHDYMLGQVRPTSTSPDARSSYSYVH